MFTVISIPVADNKTLNTNSKRKLEKRCVDIMSIWTSDLSHFQINMTLRRNLGIYEVDTVYQIQISLCRIPVTTRILWPSNHYMIGLL